MKERKLAGTLNNPNYYGGQQDRRHMKAFKIYDNLMQWAPSTSYRVYRDKCWHYSRKVGIFRCDGKVYKNDRDWNAEVCMRKRSIVPKIRYLR